MKDAAKSACSSSYHHCAWVFCLFFILAFSRAVVAADGPMGVERVARLTSLGYQSQPANKADEIRWVQVDLSQSRRIEIVKLFPKLSDCGTVALGLPVRFCLESSDDPKLKTAAKIADHSGSDYSNPGDVAGVGATPAQPDEGKGLRLDHLDCEYLTNPNGIAEPRPRLGWIIESGERGQRQTAYRVLVASTEALLKRDTGDLWDSG